jgi:hypothetical protein
VGALEVYSHEGRMKDREGIDWGKIRGEVEAGTPFRTVAARHGVKFSRISMRSTREGWRGNRQKAMGPERVEAVMAEAVLGVPVEAEGRIGGSASYSGGATRGAICVEHEG